jgi:hypothetical protein
MNCSSSSSRKFGKRRSRRQQRELAPDQEPDEDPAEPPQQPAPYLEEDHLQQEPERLMTPQELRSVATRMSNSLRISLYIREGRTHQIGPGEPIDPPKSAHFDGTHGRFLIAAASKP